MSFFYAQLNTAMVCISITETEKPVNRQSMVPIEGLDSSLLGQTYDPMTYSWEAPQAAAGKRHISVGAFFDRFGAAKWGILSDPDPLVQAVVKDSSVRSYIDLDNPDLPAGLAIIAAAGHVIDATAILDGVILEKERP